MNVRDSVISRPMPAAHGERDQRGHEGHEADPSDEERVDAAPRRAGHDARRDGHQHGRTLLQEHADDGAGDVHRGAHREVDAAGQQHDGHAHREKPHEGRRAHDVGEVRERGEARVEDAEEHEDEHEEDGRHVAQDRHGQAMRGHATCSRKAARRMASWSNCARSKDPRTSPRPITRMRSHMPSSSSSSEEMKSTAVPPAAMRSMIS